MIFITPFNHWRQQRKQYQPIKPVDIAIFLRQLAVLIAAGIPIIKCCEVLENSQEKTACRLLIYAIKKTLLSGKNLYYSFRLHPHHFDELTCQLIKIGETTGKLDTLLIALANHHENRLLLHQRLKQVLIYPGLLTGMAILVVLVMFIFVIPEFAQLFRDISPTLPALTRSMFHLAMAMQDHKWPIGFAFFFIPAISFYYLKHSPHRHWQQFFFKLPILQRLHDHIILGRFTRTLAITLSAGLPLAEALTLVLNGSANLKFIQGIARLRHHVYAGLPLYDAMSSSPCFPAFLVQMTKIGEESGTLEHMLHKTADFFDGRIEQSLNYLHQLLGPLIMIILGALIGGIIVGLYLPVFKLGSAL